MLRVEKDAAIVQIGERSDRYAALSGWRGIIAGMLALAGCYLTSIVWESYPTIDQSLCYLIIWSSVLVLTVVQDRLLAKLKARKFGETIWTPATKRSVKAFLPGMFISGVLSIRALTLYDYDAIPAIWTLGYGIALYMAGLFSIRAIRVFGIVQSVTGAISLVILYVPAINSPVLRGIESLARLSGTPIAPGLVMPLSGLLLVGLSFGVYHIIYGILTTRRHER